MQKKYIFLKSPTVYLKSYLVGHYSFGLESEGYIVHVVLVVGNWRWACQKCFSVIHCDEIFLVHLSICVFSEIRSAKF